MTNTTMKYSDCFRTSDLNLAAALSLYYSIENIEWLDHRKAEFIFTRNTSFDQIVRSFWSGDLKVEPQEFSNAIRSLKARLYRRE